MSKTFRPYDPEQQLLLPAALQDVAVRGPSGLLHIRPGGPVGPPPSNWAGSLEPITARYQGEDRGGPP